MYDDLVNQPENWPVDGLWSIWHLNSMSEIQILIIWLPRPLSDNNKNWFLSKIVSSDQKWYLYINVQNRKEWLISNGKSTSWAESVTHPRKLMGQKWRCLLRIDFEECNRKGIIEWLYSKIKLSSLRLFKSSGGSLFHTCPTLLIYLLHISISFAIYRITLKESPLITALRFKLVWWILYFQTSGFLQV